jgi:multicomponent Na+:H+ antiporter subunit A
VREHALYLPLLILILLGAFTKSAQVPFHFWLPNAMAAPTPVSAYLHSATMVKAGVYLLARLNPSLGGTEVWFTVLALFGAATMFTGVFLAFRSTGIKSVLAYSTVMALGTLTMLIGIGTETALLAAMAFLLAHSLYKGALFLVAGILDHEAGAKDFLQTGGLRAALPVTSAFAIPGGPVPGRGPADVRLRCQGTDAGVGARGTGLGAAAGPAGDRLRNPGRGSGGDRRHPSLVRSAGGDAEVAP